MRSTCSVNKILIEISNIYLPIQFTLKNSFFFVYREITFHNAEELTEEGLPFLILFYNPDDNKSIKDFKMNVAAELLSERRNFKSVKIIAFTATDRNYLFNSTDNMNFLTADGNRFAHPLEHMGKSKDDLPIIAIDSFRHMYVLPKFDEMYVPGRLKKFVDDLYSGKLHREFHYGPEEEDPTSDEAKQIVPESTFQKLKPSENRYTLRNEL